MDEIHRYSKANESVFTILILIYIYIIYITNKSKKHFQKSVNLFFNLKIIIIIIKSMEIMNKEEIFKGQIFTYNIMNKDIEDICENDSISCFKLCHKVYINFN